MIDALFSSRISFSFFEATSVHCASDAVDMVAYMWSAVLAVERGGGGGYCVEITNPPPRATHR